MKKIKDKIGSKYTPKRSKLHHLKKFLGGACTTCTTCAACRLATCKFPNLKKKFLAPLSQILATPLYSIATLSNVTLKITVETKLTCHLIIIYIVVEPTHIHHVFVYQISQQLAYEHY